MLLYIGDINLSGDNVSSIKKLKEFILQPTKEIGL
jgi:hypothetical protein